MKLERKQGFYEKYIKRALDISCSLLFIIGFSWLYLILAILVKFKIGSPVIFKQPRPGLVKDGKDRFYDTNHIMAEFPAWTRIKEQRRQQLRCRPGFGISRLYHRIF